MRSLAPVLLLLLFAPRATAQTAVVEVARDAPPERAARWRQRVGSAVEGPVTLREAARAATPAGTVEPDRLAAIAQVEARLLEAREARARLREADALRALARAEARLSANLDVPGAAAWYAEVQLALAVTAAQVGLALLSEAALRRAASVDPTRVVQAAEARPDLVRAAAAARRARATAPRGRFEVRSDAPGARVSLDDRRLGPLPRVVEAPVGPHVLRVDAPGHDAWAAVVEVREGDRPPVDVVLPPAPVLERARASEAAARAGQPAAVAAALEDWPEAPRVRLLWVGAGPRDRAVSLACAPRGCGAPQRLAEWPTPLVFDGPRESLSRALAWLDAPSAPDAPRELAWYERTELWLAAGAVVLLAGGLAAGFAVENALRDPEIVTPIDPTPFLDP